MCASSESYVSDFLRPAELDIYRASGCLFYRQASDHRKDSAQDFVKTYVSRGDKVITSDIELLL